MSTKASIALVLALVLSVVGLFTPMVKNANLGGLVHTLQEDFTVGIRVAGTEVFSAARVLTAPSGIIGSTSAGLNYYKPVVTYTADTTLTVSQTGTIFNMGTAGLDLTLPAPTAANGVHYRFVVSAAFATTDMTLVAGTADTIEGSLIVAGAVVACDAADIITIAAANEDIGDFIDLYSNGTKWMVGANQAMTASNHACSG